MEPSRQIRALTNTTVTFFCLHNSTAISDGNFHWFYDSTPCNHDYILCNHGNVQCNYDNILCDHNYTLCNSTSCRSSIDTPKSSQLTLVVGEATAGNWRCGFIKHSC